MFICYRVNNIRLPGSRRTVSFSEYAEVTVYGHVIRLARERVLVVSTIHKHYHCYIVIVYHSLTCEMEYISKTRSFPDWSCQSCRLCLCLTFQIDGTPTTQNYVSLEGGKIVVRYAPRAELKLLTGIYQFRLYIYIF